MIIASHISVHQNPTRAGKSNIVLTTRIETQKHLAEHAYGLTPKIIITDGFMADYTQACK
jgi:hypothetical protein